jgi:hypothetical protein
MTTWNNLALKHNIYIQFIIVEDSEEKDKLDIQKLVFSNLNVYYIYIDNKDWVNPCLNYEIGFNYIAADYVVVCNAEVCIFGDIYTTIKQLLTEKRYLMFDVAQTGHSMYQNYDNNQEIYDNYNSLEDKCNSYHKMYGWLKTRKHVWLQGRSTNSGYHYCIAIHSKTLKRVRFFDLDFSLGVRLDDRISVYKLKNHDRLEFVNIFHNNHNVLGMHQWHPRNYVSRASGDLSKMNQILYNFKVNHHKQHNKYITFYDEKDKQPIIPVEHTQSDLERIYTKIIHFYSNFSIQSLIENNCNVHYLNKKQCSMSVVFTCHNRDKQTYFTLQSWDFIAKQNNTNIQIIIVEDSESVDSRLDIERLRLDYTNLYIVYVLINRKEEGWINACLNYNIGFEFIDTDRVVITNAEVCVFGDIYTRIKNTLTKNNYLVFDVLEMGKSHCSENRNEEVWKYCSSFGYDDMIDYVKNKHVYWLQSKTNNRCFHFLTALHKETLCRIKGFDNEFILNFDYDDNNFITKIKNFYKIDIVNIFAVPNKILGIHQWHTKHPTSYYTSNALRKYNKILYYAKAAFAKKHNKYLHIKEFPTFSNLIENMA